MKQGWKIKKLGEVFDLQMGKTPSRDNGDYWGGDNVWIAISDLQDKYIGKSKEHITDKALTETKIKKVKAGTTIMSFKLSVGRAAITTQDLYTNEAIMAFNLNEGYDLIADYIYYYLKGYKWQGANKAAMGLTLNKASISQNHIAIPPREEQEKIVEELDCLSGVIEKKREQLRELDALAQSIFYQMFGDPITNEKGWEVLYFNEVAEIVGGSTPKTNIEEYWNGDNYWVTPAELHGERYIYSTERCITDDAVSKTHLTLLPIGSVLLSSRAPIGKVCITRVPMYCNQGFKNIVCSDRLHSEYVYQFLFEKTEYLNSLGTGATFKEISKRVVEQVTIPVPPMKLQQEFADKIEAIEKQKALIKQSITQTEELFNSRMAYYFN